MRFQVQTEHDGYRVLVRIGTTWERTSILSESYHDAMGEIIAIVTRKPYVNYFDWRTKQ